MKKNISICIIILLILGGTMFGCKPYEYNKDSYKPQNGILFLDDLVITDENVLIYHKPFVKNRMNYPGTELPLTVILQSLGMNVEWVDNNFANLIYNEKKYILDLEKVSIIEEGKNSNLISGTEGGCKTYKILEKELLLDDGTISSFMTLIGEPIFVNIDYDKLIVYIISKNTQ